MEIILKRTTFTDNSTIGELKVANPNGLGYHAFSIEDVDRELHQTDNLTKIKSIKVHGKTAIPYGRYRVIVSYSNRFKKYLPELLDVPGWAGVRIHAGNTSADTEGCILPGFSKTTDFVGESRKAFDALFKLIKEAEKKEKIYITIK